MFVPVRSYDNYIPANMTLQRLEEEGITAYLQDENTVTTMPIWNIAVGGIKLMVQEEEAPRAIEFLNQWEKEFREAGACPKCGSHNIVYVPQPSNPRNWLVALLSWSFTSYAVAPEQVYKCSDCGNEFEDIS